MDLHLWCICFISTCLWIFEPSRSWSLKAMMLVKRHASPRVAFQTPSVCLSLCSAVLKFLPRPPGTQKGDHISRQQRGNIVWNNANPCWISLQVYAKDMWLLFLEWTKYIEELIAYGIRPKTSANSEKLHIFVQCHQLFFHEFLGMARLCWVCAFEGVFFTRKAPSCVKWKVEASCNHLWNLNLNNFTTFTDDIRWLYLKHWAFLKSWITNHPIGVAVV